MGILIAFGPVGPVRPVFPTLPIGILKLRVISAAVPPFVTDAADPGPTVVVVPKVTVFDRGKPRLS